MAVSGSTGYTGMCRM